MCDSAIDDDGGDDDNNNNIFLQELLPLLRKAAASGGGPVGVSRAAVINMSTILASMGSFVGNADIYGYRASKVGEDKVRGVTSRGFGRRGTFTLDNPSPWIPNNPSSWILDSVGAD